MFQGGEGNIVWCNKLAQYLLARWLDDSGQPISNLIRTPDFIKYLNKQDFSGTVRDAFAT
ncbi:hypothetical protein O9929_03195 [Vibrio lentus]|nr:hypothetical protein [Vibrio lentus]